MADPRDPDEVEDDQEDLLPDDETTREEDEAEVQGEEGAVEEAAVEERPAAAQPRARQDWQRIAREEAEHRQRVERELHELRTRAQPQQQPAQPQEEPEEQFEARMQLLPVQDQVRERLSRSERRHQMQLALTRLQAADAADRAAYQSRAAADPRYKKYADQVEQILSVERRQGRDFPRETVLKFIIGERVLANAGKVKQAQAQGQQRVQRQQARPIGDRSDRAAARPRAGTGNTLADLEARLDGVLI